MNSAEMTQTEMIKAVQDDTTDTYMWRCTRNECYPRGCNGFSDLSIRAGHYIYACTWFDALKQMIDLFPHDTQGFTCERYGNAIPKR